MKDDEDSEMDNKGSKGENKVCVSRSLLKKQETFNTEKISCFLMYKASRWHYAF